MDFGGSDAHLCRMCNIRHFGECKRGNNACYTCGQMGHRVAHCPQNQQRPQQPSLPPPAPTQQASEPSGYAQTGRGVLIDCGDTHSVVSYSFAQMTQPHPTPLGYDLEFSMPIGERCYVDRVYLGCPVLVEDVVMPANLILLDIVEFDVILGIDWLHYNRVMIDCYGKAVTFHRPGLPEVTFVGEPSGVRHGVISAVKAKTLLSKGCQGYLAHMVLNDNAPSNVEDVRVVRHFPDVFPDDLLG
ncbi:uncharacterized protein [Malus domestica]|uniref:uncharacterized protein n=1 Tax=Malus domestica TaxID=3750 RepID=UPI0039767EA9